MPCGYPIFKLQQWVTGVSVHTLLSRISAPLQPLFGAVYPAANDWFPHRLKKQIRRKSYK